VEKLFYLAIGLVALGSFLGVVGSIIGAILTKDFRKDVTDKQEQIIKLDSAISHSVELVKNLNVEIKTAQDEIKTTTTLNKELSESNKILNEEIKKASAKLTTEQKLITELSKEIRVLSKESRDIVENNEKLAKKLEEFLIGGDTFLIIGCWFDDSVNYITFNPYLQNGDLLRNVKVKMIDQRYKYHRRQSFDIKETTFGPKIIHNEGAVLMLDFGDLKSYRGISYPTIDDKHYQDGIIHFLFDVDAENFKTRQEHYYKKLPNNEIAFFMKITITSGEQAGKVLKLSHRNIEFHEKGYPLLPEN